MADARGVGTRFIGDDWKIIPFTITAASLQLALTGAVPVRVTALRARDR